jgi:carboxyl-terminal processing protease
VYTLPYGAGLALTTAKYYTPSGRWIQRPFEDLLSYVNPDDIEGPADGEATAAEPKPAEGREEGEVFYTDAGRIVYAQGGITPDYAVKQDDRVSKLLPQLLARGMFFNFAVDYAARNPDLPAEVKVDERLRDEFFRFAEKNKFSSVDELERQFAEDPLKDRIDLAIRIEIANVRAGLEAGRRIQITGDTQVQKALELFPEAERIAALPKRSGTAVRASKDAPAAPAAPRSR